MKKVVVFLMVTILTFALAACGGEKLVWPTNGMAANLPPFQAKKGEIEMDFDNTLRIRADKVSSEQFTTYVQDCKNKGFNIEASETVKGYSAFSDSGYFLDLSYDDDDKEMTVQLNAPKVTGDISWPSMGLAQLIPIPKSSKGEIAIDNSTQFAAYIGETSIEDYNAYISECTACGFSLNHNKDQKWFEAENQDGVSLRLDYEGFNTMRIAIYANDSEEKESEVSSEIASSEEASAEESISSAESSENQAISKAVSAMEQAVESGLNALESAVTSGLDKFTSSSEAPSSAAPSSSAVREPSSSIAESSSAPANSGIRPDFKAAMDSYESFYKEYCALLKSYKASPTDLSLLTKYTEMMAKATDVDQKFKAWDQSTMNDAELKYYLDVNNRVLQMLAEVS